MSRARAGLAVVCFGARLALGFASGLLALARAVQREVSRILEAAEGKDTRAHGPPRR